MCANIWQIFPSNALKPTAEGFIGVSCLTQLLWAEALRILLELLCLKCRRNSKEAKQGKPGTPVLCFQLYSELSRRGWKGLWHSELGCIFCAVRKPLASRINDGMRCSWRMESSVNVCKQLLNVMGKKIPLHLFPYRNCLLSLAVTLSLPISWQ